jgi:hypothetical protein
MARPPVGIVPFASSLLAAALLTVSGSSAAGAASPDATGCTVVYAADATSAFGGNNEDERNPLTNIWFVPGENGRYGSAFVGYDDMVIQGGVNERGLFFDALGVRDVTVPQDPAKPAYTGQNLFFDLMTRCGSVACVREQFQSFSFPGPWNGQALFGDALGDSVIVEPLAMIPKTDRFQVATNFFQSEVPASARTDERYVTATAMLAAADRPSKETIRDVLEATHQTGDVNTVYSTIYDLRAGLIYLYYFGDFTSETKFDVRAELAQGLHRYAIPDLFGANAAANVVAAPIRERLASDGRASGRVTVDRPDLEPFTGTYQADGIPPLSIGLGPDGLQARQPWTPWVDLVPTSAGVFTRASSDGGGAIHALRLRFDGTAADGRGAVEITADDGASIVATRITPPGSMIRVPVGLTALFTAIAAGAVLWVVGRARRHTRTAPIGA